MYHAIHQNAKANNEDYNKYIEDYNEYKGSWYLM